MNKDHITGLFKKCFRYPALILVALLFIFTGLAWCIFTMLIIFFSHKLIGNLKANRVAGYIITPVYLILTFIYALLVRLFFVGIFLVPSESMENQIFPGDFLLVNRLSYGPKLPASPFTIPFLSLVFYNKTITKKDSTIWGYHRLPGYTTVKRNDILVFDMPGQTDLNLVKRCVGLPGETIALKNGITYIDGRPVNTAVTIKQDYELTVKKPDKFIKFSKDHQININFNASVSGESITCTMTDMQKQLLLKTGNVATISLARPNDAISTTGIITKNSDLNNFGPVIIPKHGIQIQMTPKSYQLYRYIIQHAEGKSIVLSDSTVYINGRKSKSYNFEHDYYFVLGDNRYNSKDSRYWGFLPESYIEGKAVAVLFSADSTKVFSWDRFLLSLH